MKVTFTEEMLNKYRKANDEVSATDSYNKYYMMREVKIEKKWVFCGWAFIDATGYFTNKKNGLYIYTTTCFGEKVRYTVTKEVYELFKDEFPKVCE